MLVSGKKSETSVPWAHLRIPPFPQVAIRVLQLANNEKVRLTQLSELISSDAAFASEVLTVANSLLYAPRFPSTSILQAISVLGSDHLQGMCMTVGMRAYLGRSLSDAAMRSLWRHSLACAVIAERLAGGGSLSNDSAYTSGVLHDVGRFGMAVIRPKEYTELLGKHEGTAASILEAESELFGIHHCEVGRKLILDWKLSSEFSSIVCDHHSPRNTEGIGCWNMSELIKVSCQLADGAGFPAFPGCTVTPYEELLDLLPPMERSQLPRELEALQEDVATRIQGVESV
jgi:HD-like signal output (HDOD) protein